MERPRLKKGVTYKATLEAGLWPYVHICTCTHRKSQIAMHVWRWENS